MSDRHTLSPDHAFWLPALVIISSQDWGRADQPVRLVVDFPNAEGRDQMKAEFTDTAAAVFGAQESPSRITFSQLHPDRVAEYHGDKDRPTLVIAATAADWMKFLADGVLKKPAPQAPANLLAIGAAA